MNGTLMCPRVFNVEVRTRKLLQLPRILRHLIADEWLFSTWTTGPLITLPVALMEPIKKSEVLVINKDLRRIRFAIYFQNFSRKFFVVEQKKERVCILCVTLEGLFRVTFSCRLESDSLSLLNFSCHFK